jgi:hypothetical protein
MGSRLQEAIECNESASEDDRYTIRRFMSCPKKAMQHTPSQTHRACQWLPGQNEQPTAEDIGQHVMEHFSRVDFADMVKGFDVNSIQQLNACANHIHQWYLLHNGLGEEFRQFEYVG